MVALLSMARPTSGAWNSHEWDGDTLVEHSKWKMREMTLLFERRLTFSPDGKELYIAERITGPKGKLNSNDTLPVD